MDSNCNESEPFAKKDELEKKQYTTPVTSPATSRSATDGWKDLSTNDHDGSLLNGTTQELITTGMVK